VAKAGKLVFKVGGAEVESEGVVPHREWTPVVFVASKTRKRLEVGEGGGLLNAQIYLDKELKGGVELEELPWSDADVAMGDVAEEGRVYRAGVARMFFVREDLATAADLERFYTSERTGLCAKV
jgi:hypothetical protein